LGAFWSGRKTGTLAVNWYGKLLAMAYGSAVNRGLELRKDAIGFVRGPFSSQMESAIWRLLKNYQRTDRLKNLGL
jgi:hypothetical protein